jgi:spore coat polysaccharide biosynthesis protein SpsF
MPKTYTTEQEAFWSGAFGDAYVDRNTGDALIAGRTHLLSNVLRMAGPVGSIVEFGPNLGLNMVALQRLLPAAQRTAIEINARAVDHLRKDPDITVHHGSILETHIETPHDLVFTCGVLIHISPDALPVVYDRMYAASRRLIAVIEYYNPSPVEIPYRGHQDRLFKRDFAGELLDRFPDLRLIDYGFQYHRDPNFPVDDLTWFLLEKSK